MPTKPIYIIKETTMNKTVEDLITRRSVRKFKDHPVPKELLDQVIEAGLYAPSGRNFQSSIIIAVSNPELRNRIAEINWDRRMGQGL